MGQASGHFQLPFSAEAIENFVLKVGFTRSDVRRIGSPQMALARDYGQQLFASLFNPGAYALLHSTLNQAKLAGDGVTIRLHLQNTPKPAHLPWEYLYDAATASFLSLSAATPVIQFIELGQSVLPLATALPLRILGVVSNPRNLGMLDVETEKQNLTDVLLATKQWGVGQALEVQWLPSPHWTSYGGLSGETRFISSISWARPL